MMKSKRAVPEPLLTIAEFAQACGVHHMTVRRAIAAGEVKASRIRGVWRIPPSEYRRIVHGDCADGAA